MEKEKSFKITEEEAIRVGRLMSGEIYAARYFGILKKIDLAMDVLFRIYIPQHILDFCSQNKEWIETSRMVGVTCGRKPDLSGRISFDVPMKSSTINVSEEEYGIIEDLSEAAKLCHSNRIAYKNDVAEALLMLETSKRVKEKFPEAYKLLIKNPPKEKGEVKVEPEVKDLNKLRKMYNASQMSHVFFVSRPLFSQ